MYANGQRIIPSNQHTGNKTTPSKKIGGKKIGGSLRSIPRVAVNLRGELKIKIDILKIMVDILNTIPYNSHMGRHPIRKELPLMDLRNHVRELRARHRLSQSDLAEKIGSSRQTIAMIEKGDYAPSIVLALKIAQTFEQSVDTVFYLDVSLEKPQQTEEGGV
jgi:putative transcriptional regulator